METDPQAELTRAEADLDQVDDLLARIDAGTDGRCDVCGTGLESPLARACPAHDM